MDWRETGKQTYEYVKGRREADLKSWRERESKPSEPLDSKTEMCHALIKCARGDTDLLVEYLLSDKRFTLQRKDREWLAAVLRHKVKAGCHA